MKLTKAQVEEAIEYRTEDFVLLDATSFVEPPITPKTLVDIMQALQYNGYTVIEIVRHMFIAKQNETKLENL